MAQKSQKSITHYFKSPSNNKNETPIAQSKKKEVSKKRKREETDAKLKVEDQILDPIKKDDENEADDSKQQNTSKIEDEVESESKKDEKEDVDEPSGSPQQKKRHTNGSAENENSSVPEEKCKPLIEDNALLDGAEYNPAKHNYHPTKDAFWKKGSDTPYLALSRAFQLIEEIKGRLKSIEILSNFFRSVIVLSPQDLLACMYLSVNQLAPAHEGLELGIAETSLMRAICSATGQSLTHLKSKLDAVGDLGIIAEQARSSQRVMFRPAPLTVKGVFEALKYVAKLSGQSAMNKKMDKIKGIFVACRHSEARYIIRSLLGKLRIGIAEQSALQALANAISSTQSTGSTNAAASKKSADEHFMILKTTYCQCPIYDRIIPLLLKHDISELPKLCQMEAGIPIKPMLAQPMTGVHEVLSRFEGMRFTCEFKYDGERAQIHCDEKGTISIYSRNQENNTTKYPDIIERIPHIPKEGVTSYIIDSEVVAWDIENKQILPFQKLITRKRKNVESSDIQVQVCVYMFDLLYLNGEALVSRSFIERRQLLRDNFQEVEGQWKFATSCDTNDIDELQQFLELSIKGNCEGLMIKTLEKEADYEIARRSRNWLKLKKDYVSGTGDSLDLVVIGAYTGKGKRTGVYGGFLLACYDANSEEYQCICKIGTGFSDEDLKDHYAALKDHIIKTPKSYYQYDSSLEADVWFEPVLVWEIKCADLSLSPVHKAGVGIIDADKGISLRFPRFLRIRDDKNAEDATSAQQVVDMYLAQSQIVNQNSAAKNDMDDFY